MTYDQFFFHTRQLKGEKFLWTPERTGRISDITKLVWSRFQWWNPVLYCLPWIMINWMKISYLWLLSWWGGGTRMAAFCSLYVRTGRGRVGYVQPGKLTCGGQKLIVFISASDEWLASVLHAFWPSDSALGHEAKTTTQHWLYFLGMCAVRWLVD